VKALIVDDEEDVRYVARVSLGSVGSMTVIEASSGEEALERARSERPDVILLDVMMPGMDGASTFHALQASPETAAIPVVFLTARGMAGEVARLRDLGSKGIILKPFDPLTLAAEVEAILDL
jgi:two-component system OmpR family response regulator